MAPAADPSLKHSINPSTEEAEEAAAAADPSQPHPYMAADPLPTDNPQTIQGSIPIVDYLRATFDDNAWRAATGDLENPPRLPLLCSISDDGTTLIAVDCLSDTGAPRAHSIPLPDHLHGHNLFSSIGHCLLLENSATLSGIRLFNPFLDSSSSTQAACLPPSVSLKPHPNSSLEEEKEKDYPNQPEFHEDYEIYAVLPDTKRGIALALMEHYDFRLAYTMLDCSGVDGHWIDLTELAVTDDRTYFQSALLYKGLFCAVDHIGNMVISLDISRDSVEHRDITFDLPNNYLPIEHVPIEHVDADWCCYQSARLINSGSSLYLVRWRNTVKEYGVKPKREIDVFLLNDSSKSWGRVKSLDGHSFFIGKNLSFSISTIDFPELQSNQVYLCSDAGCPIAGNELSRPYDFDNIDEFGLHLVHNLNDGEWRVYYGDTPRMNPVHSSRFTMWMLPPAGSMA